MHCYFIIAHCGINSSPPDEMIQCYWSNYRGNNDFFYMYRYISVKSMSVETYQLMTFSLWVLYERKELRSIIPVTRPLFYINHQYNYKTILLWLASLLVLLWGMYIWSHPVISNIVLNEWLIENNAKISHLQIKMIYTKENISISAFDILKVLSGIQSALSQLNERQSFTRPIYYLYQGTALHH